MNRKIALYGEPGARKTLQARYLIEAFGHENVGIISAEQGLGTIASAIQPEHVQEVTNLDELRKAYAWAKAKYTKPDQWVVVDGGSRIFNWVSQEVWQSVDKVYDEILSGTARRALPDALKPYGRFITGKDEIDGMRCWVAVGSNAGWLMDAFIKLPASLMMTFWAEKPNIDQYTKGAQYHLDLPGKGTRDAVVGSFDFIFRLVSVNKNYSKAICRTTTTSFAKSRDDRTVYEVPDEIEPFNLAEFIKKVEGGA
jgi:hypothetical protein